MIKLAPDFERKLAKAGFTKAQLATATGLSLSGIHGLINPAQQPKRRGGIRPVNAWKIAKAVAEKTGETEDAAYAQLFEEVEAVGADGRRITQTPAVC
jgi:hypothetical protein